MGCGVVPGSLTTGEAADEGFASGGSEELGMRATHRRGRGKAGGGTHHMHGRNHCTRGQSQDPHAVARTLSMAHCAGIPYC